MIRHAESGIDILAAPPRPEQAEGVTGDQFSTLIQFLQTMYPYVILDAPANLNEIALSAFDVTDLIIVVTTQDIPAIRNARMFLDLTSALGIPKQRIMFVMNLFDRRIGISAEKVEDSFKQSISVVIPRERRIVVPSINRGVPFMMLAKNKSQPVARGILDLAEAVRHRLTELDEQMQQMESAAVAKR